MIDGQVMIIDEFTGRILEGRRWSEGLHQAIEAKEGVRIREENQTLATITLQNYFRLYDKLSGMTGTALTEAQEFMKIYEMPVVEIPTHRPMVRADHNDQIYKTKPGKWKAVVRRDQRAQRGRPADPDRDDLGRGLGDARRRVQPQRDRARRPEREARARRARGRDDLPGGPDRRGHDRHQHGRPRRRHQARRRPGGDGQGGAGKKGVKPGADGYDAALAEVLPALEEQCAAEGDKVRELGGLFICGTERHESRRIDNQLRGRSGRQGDPGESRFFLSAEDDLVRLFAGDRIYRILDRLGPVDEEGEEYPLEAKMLTKQIENAQKKVEQQNFLIRKRVLEYDDVMNEQRRVVYKYRREILEGRDMSDVAYEEVGQVAVRLTDEFTAGDIFEEWDLAGLRSQAESIWGGGAELEGLDPNTSSREDIGEMLREEALKAYEAREEELGEELTRWLERQILLQIIDNRWREHLYEMDYLREGIHLRGFAQIDPLVAYKNEGFSMFEELMASIWQEFARVIFHVEVNVEPQQQQQAPARGPQQVNYSGGTEDGQPSALRDAAAAAAAGAPAAAAATTTAEPQQEQQRPHREPAGTVVKSEHEKLGRNDPAGAAPARSSRTATAVDPGR